MFGGGLALKQGLAEFVQIELFQELLSHGQGIASGLAKLRPQRVETFSFASYLF